MTGTKPAIEWLSSVAPDPEACRWEWERNPHGVALLPAGKAWDVLILPGELGYPTLDVLTRVLGRPGPVLVDFGDARMGFLVPPGTAARWVGTGIRTAGDGTWIVVPYPGRASAAGRAGWSRRTARARSPTRSCSNWPCTRRRRGSPGGRRRSRQDDGSVAEALTTRGARTDAKALRLPPSFLVPPYPEAVVDRRRPFQPFGPLAVPVIAAPAASGIPPGARAADAASLRNGGFASGLDDRTCTAGLPVCAPRPRPRRLRLRRPAGPTAGRRLLDGCSGRPTATGRSAVPPPNTNWPPRPAASGSPGAPGRRRRRRPGRHRAAEARGGPPVSAAAGRGAGPPHRTRRRRWRCGRRGSSRPPGYGRGAGAVGPGLQGHDEHRHQDHRHGSGRGRQPPAVPARGTPCHATYARADTRTGTATSVLPRSASSSEARSGRRSTLLSRSSRSTRGPSATTCQVISAKTRTGGPSSSMVHSFAFADAPPFAAAGPGARRRASARGEHWPFGRRPAARDAWTAIRIGTPRAPGVWGGRPSDREETRNPGAPVVCARARPGRSWGGLGPYRSQFPVSGCISCPGRTYGRGWARDRANRLLPSTPHTFFTRSAARAPAVPPGRLNRSGDGSDVHACLFRGVRTPARGCPGPRSAGPRR